MSEVVSYQRRENIALIIINNPPVNALSTAVRQGLWNALDQFMGDDKAQAAVLLCAGSTFIAGADIREFNKPPQEPLLPALIARIEQTPKLMVAALHGTALGGGFETALGCHYRCALAGARVGLPEVNLGLLPGAGGTQRLPRLAGIKTALEMILSGKPVPAPEALASGIIDKVLDDDLREGAVRYAQQLLAQGAGPRLVSELTIDVSELDVEFFSGYEKKLERDFRGYLAPFQILKCIRASLEMPFDEGIKFERRLFEECKASTHSKAQRHLFFAERAAARVPGITKDTPVRDISSAAVIGSGGIPVAVKLLDAGIPVVFKETNGEALEAGMKVITSIYKDQVQKGRMKDSQAGERMALIQGSVEDVDVAGVDLAIVIASENRKSNQEICQQLSEVCRESVIIACSSPTLEFNGITAAVHHSENLIGMNFYYPFNTAKFVEIIRTDDTADEVLATIMALVKRIKTSAVTVRACPGSAGSRMFIPYMRETWNMIREGADPKYIDKVIYEWGMPMGPNLMIDQPGFESYRESAAGEGATIEAGQRDIKEEEIIERLLYPVINEGAKLLEEGAVIRPGDIDVIWTLGFGMPRYRGGPMMYADIIGLEHIIAGLHKYHDQYGKSCWESAPLLEQLVAKGRTFGEWE